MTDEVAAVEAQAESLKSSAVPSVMPDRQPKPEQEVKAEVVETETETEEAAEESATSEDDAQHPKKNKGVGKRINELTKEKHEALRRAEAAERERDELRSKATKPEQAHAKPEGKPTLEQFDYDYEAYTDALSDWKIDQKLSERDQRSLEEANKSKIEEQSKAVQSRIDAYAAKDPDGWKEALTAPINYTQTMVETLRESEIGPEMGVYLARNLDEAEQISRMNPVAAARALGRIEAKLESTQAEAKPKVDPPKKLTQTPPPAKTLSGAAVAMKDVDRAGITPEERIAIWRAQRRSR